MDSIAVYALPMDDYLITAEVLDDAISISVELEHEIVLNLFEYPAEITVLSAKITEVEEVANAAKETADTAKSTADAASSAAGIADDKATAAETQLGEAITAASIAESKATEALSAASAAPAAAVATLRDGVSDAGDTLKKLYNLILSQFVEKTVADITERNAFNAPLGCHVFVSDDGDTHWALYKATTAGVNATYIKLSDPDLLNAAMTASGIKVAYESNPDTNAFTNALRDRLNALSATSSPEFANTFNTALNTSAATGGEITPTLWAWIASVYATIVAKSVKSHIIGLWTSLNSLAGRVGVLENNVILDVTLAVDTVNVTLTLPSTEESVLLEYGSPTGMNSNDTVNSNLQINGVTTSSYVTSTLRYNTVLFYTGRHAFFGTLEIRRINGYLFFVNTAQHIWGNTSTQTIAGRFMQGFLELAQPGINSITIYGSYKTGTRFRLIRKK